MTIAGLQIPPPFALSGVPCGILLITDVLLVSAEGVERMKHVLFAKISFEAHFFLNVSRTAFNQLPQARELCMMRRWLGRTSHHGRSI